MKTKIKKLTNAEVLTTLARINNSADFGAISLPIKFLWELKKNIGRLEEIKVQFDKMVEEINKVYSDEEHSVPSKDKDQNEIREVKKEYLDEFIKKKTELLEADNEVRLSVFSIEDLGEPAFTLETLRALSVFIDDAEDQ